MTMEILKTRIDEILKKMWGVNEDGGIEIYTDYRERELSDSFLKEIFEHNNPKEAFNDELADWAMDYAMKLGEDELEKDIRKELTDEEEEYFPPEEEYSEDEDDEESCEEDMQPVDELFSLCSEQLKVIDAKEKAEEQKCNEEFLAFTAEIGVVVNEGGKAV